MCERYVLKTIRTKTIRRDPDGEGGQEENLVQFAGMSYEEAVKRYAENNSKRCQHSYDCCGRVYGYVLTNTARRIGSDAFTVRRTWYVNI